MLTAKITFSTLAILLLVAHLFFPQFKIDPLSILLLGAASIPWLSSLFKSVEMPGGFKVEFQDLEKITKRAEDAGLLETAPSKEYGFELVATSDPNLALAGLRIEIEKKLRQLAVEHGGEDRTSIRRNIEMLSVYERLSSEQVAVIQDLVPILNSAVHGAVVDAPTVSWALTTGRRILANLERIDDVPPNV